MSIIQSTTLPADAFSHLNSCARGHQPYNRSKDRTPHRRESARGGGFSGALVVVGPGEGA
jgi:hypothetical protein